MGVQWKGVDIPAKWYINYEQLLEVNLIINPEALYYHSASHAKSNFVELVTFKIKMISEWFPNLKCSLSIFFKFFCYKKENRTTE